MYTYEYICMYSLSYHSTTTHWNICIWCVKNCKDIPCLNFRAICSCIPGQGLKALNPSPENWTARHNGKETTVTVSLSADLAQEPLCQIPRRCHWFLVLDLKKNIQMLPIPKRWTPHYSRDCSLIGMGGCVRIRKRNMFRTLICKAMQTCICISFYLYSGVIK